MPSSGEHPQPVESRTENRRNKLRKSLPQRAWDWRMRRIPGAQYATLLVVEEAFVAGARWALRSKKS